MEEKRKFFGYEKEKILENFRDCSDQVDVNGRIGEKTTLFQLVEASNRLLQENADFLRSIYNELDD